MLSKADVWQLRERESKSLHYPHFLNFLHFPFLGLCVTRKQKSIVVNWRVGDAQSTVHMQDGTCALVRGMIHTRTFSISSISNK